jgi:hypothetical protein
MPANICRGSVRWPGPRDQQRDYHFVERGCEREHRALRPRRQDEGSVTRRNVSICEAPRFSAARISVRSKLASVARTVMTTKRHP